MPDKLRRVEIHNQPNSDTYRAREIFESGRRWVQYDYGTIGEAARAHLDQGVPVYNLTGNRSALSPRNLITKEAAESGELG